MGVSFHLPLIEERPSHKSAERGEHDTDAVVAFDEHEFRRAIESREVVEDARGHLGKLRPTQGQRFELLIMIGERVLDRASILDGRR